MDFFFTDDADGIEVRITFLPKMPGACQGNADRQREGARAQTGAHESLAGRIWIRGYEATAAMFYHHVVGRRTGAG